jgi:hypothetical protein
MGSLDRFRPGVASTCYIDGVARRQIRETRAGTHRDVVIAGNRFQLRRSTVTKAMRKVLPEPLNQHYVVIDGRRYPPKQVIAEITGLDRADFTTHQARRVLLRLGFPAARTTRKPPTGTQRRSRKERTTSRADELRPYIGQWVATAGDEVLVAATNATEVVGWLAEHGKTAESMFRVPESDAAAGGVAPL